MLDTLPEIKIGTKYYLPSSTTYKPTDYSFYLFEEQTSGFPASLEVLANANIVYEILPG